MNKKQIATMALVGALALGGTVTAFASSANAASNNSVSADSSKSVVTEQLQEGKDQAKEAEEQDENVTLPVGGITKEEAISIAQKSIPGGTVNADTVELEDENGTIVYGVEIQTGNATHDVKINAIDGQIMKADQDKDEKDSVEEGSKTGDNDNVEHENENEDSEGYED
ncbi:MAG: PepSY domain-containing protein [Sedimentibacter sp.]